MYILTFTIYISHTFWKKTIEREHCYLIMIVYKMYGFPSDKEAKEELRKTGKLQQAGINELYTVRSFELIVEFSCLKNQTMGFKK